MVSINIYIPCNLQVKDSKDVLGIQRITNYILDWLIPVILYRLAFEEGFYERIRQSAGFMPDSLMRKIEGRRAIWVHAASVGEMWQPVPL